MASIKKIRVANVDIGDSGHPGSSASQITCGLWVRSDGRWEAVGEHSTGSNQGHYQENYGHGPWTGRGSTPQDAVRDMVKRADDDYQADMRRAGHDALLECDGSVTFAVMAGREADRLGKLIANGDGGRPFFWIAGERHYASTEEERNAVREKAIKQLRRLAGDSESPLASISDDELLAEIERRGLLTSGGTE